YLPYTHNPSTKPWERYDLHPYDWDGNVRSREDQWARIARLGTEGAAALEPFRQVPSEGIYEVIHGIAHNTNQYRVSINVTNNGAIENLPDQTIVETPAVISGMGILPQRMGALPP